VLLFVDYNNFTQVAQKIKECIEEEPRAMVSQQFYVQHWWSRELEVFDKVLKAYFN